MQLLSDKREEETDEDVGIDDGCPDLKQQNTDIQRSQRQADEAVQSEGAPDYCRVENAH